MMLHETQIYGLKTVPVTYFSAYQNTRTLYSLLFVSEPDNSRTLSQTASAVITVENTLFSILANLKTEDKHQCDMK